MIRKGLFIAVAASQVAFAGTNVSPSHAPAEPALSMPSRVLEGTPPSPTSLKAAALRAYEIALPVMTQKRAEAPSKRTPIGRQKVGDVRSVGKPAFAPLWTAAAGGYVAKVSVTSPGALGIRAEVVLSGVPADAELRFVGADAAVVEGPLPASNFTGEGGWTFHTAGPTQTIEIFSRSRPTVASVNVARVSHLAEDIRHLADRSGACNVDVNCGTGNAAIDTALQTAKNAVAQLVFNEGLDAFICTGTLLNTEKFPEPFLLTANHCISTQAVASTLQARFFRYRQCGVATDDAPGQSVSGAQLVFTNYNPDHTLLKLNTAPPAGTTFVGWNGAALQLNDSIVGVHHPRGDPMKVSTGRITDFTGQDGLIGVSGYPQPLYGVQWQRGITEGGSSGSGLFTLTNGQLELRGVLSGTTLRFGGLSCSNLNDRGLYGRFEIFLPQIQRYISNAPVPADDYGNDFASAAPLAPNETKNGALSYAGDLDVFKVTFAQAGSWTVRTIADPRFDSIGTIYDESGAVVVANDDGVPDGQNFNFGIRYTVKPGTYYLSVGHFQPQGTGSYQLQSTFTTQLPNYTEFWWGGDAESGWGLNLNHQFVAGNETMFGALFNYDADGKPLWLVMSNGKLQPDGSYEGDLYRSTGPAFNASPWTITTPRRVGSMSLEPLVDGSMIMFYDVDGRSAGKIVKLFAFGTPLTCTFVTGDRASTPNFTDLWWNPAESGWGFNVSQKGNVLFGTIYTYDATGRDLWLVTQAARTGSSSFSGDLYYTTGPVFDSQPWNPSAIVRTTVGSAQIDFTDGRRGTLTYTYNGVRVVKQIERFVFGEQRPDCR